MVENEGEITEFILCIVTCSRVKMEQYRPLGISITNDSEMGIGNAAMDFVVRFLKSEESYVCSVVQGYDDIRWTKH